MSNQDRTIVYTFVMKTNVQEQAETIKESTAEAEQSVQNVKNEQNELTTSTENATQALSDQQKQLLVQVGSLMAVRSAVSGVTNGLIQLGLVSGEDAEKLQKVNSAFQLMAGMAQGIKALTLVNEAFNLSMLKGALISTYNSIIESPWKLGLVAMGAGAAIGAVAALGISSMNQGSTTNNIYIEDSGNGQAATATALSATISGGKII